MESVTHLRRWRPVGSALTTQVLGILKRFRESTERWLNIPQPELRHRVAEIPTEEPLFLFCDTGARSYEAQVFLSSQGIVDTRQVQGGYAMVRMTDPAFG